MKLGGITSRFSVVLRDSFLSPPSRFVPILGTGRQRPADSPTSPTEGRGLVFLASKGRGFNRISPRNDLRRREVWVLRLADAELLVEFNKETTSGGERFSFCGTERMVLVAKASLARVTWWSGRCRLFSFYGGG
jgi:hypothetical protein